MKKISLTAFGVLLGTVLLVGCGTSIEIPTPVTEPLPQTKETDREITIEEKLEQAGAETEEELMVETARDMYLAFLSGDRTVKYEEDSWIMKKNPDQEYTFLELKDAVAEEYGHESYVRYGFCDFGKDGVEEMVVRFENVDSSFMNWVAVIRLKDDGLHISYDYADGYRTSSFLYETGYLQIGGSFSAGSHGYVWYELDAEGVPSILYSYTGYFSTFATSVIYDLEENPEPLDEDYSGLSDDFYLMAYRDDEKTLIAVDAYCEDDETRQVEEAFVAELVSRGAQEITADEMQKLVDESAYAKGELPMEHFYMEAEAPLAFSGVDVIHAGYATEAQLDNFWDYTRYELNGAESEYQVHVALTVDELITQIRIYELSAAEWNDATIIYRAEEVQWISALPADRTLILDMVFAGDIANYGIAYCDGAGNEHVYGIEQSGYDGSVILTEIEILQE